MRDTMEKKNEEKTKVGEQQSKSETTAIRRSSRIHNQQKKETIIGVRRSDRLARKCATKN